MQTGRIEPTAEDGREALRGHLLDRALAARAAHGPELDADALARLLEDPEVVRFPTRLVVDDDGDLLPGEFAWARPRGERPSDGFDLLVHSHFRDRPEVWSLLVGYHLPSVNYLDIAAREEAELFGAALNGLEIEDYYARLCALADELPDAPERAPYTASLVVVAEPDADVRFLQAQLEKRSDCAVGKPVGDRLPVVLAAPDAGAAEEGTRILAGMPGVGGVEVVAIGLDAGATPCGGDPVPASAGCGTGCGCGPTAPAVTPPVDVFASSRPAPEPPPTGGCGSGCGCGPTPASGGGAP